MRNNAYKENQWCIRIMDLLTKSEAIRVYYMIGKEFYSES